VSSNIRSSVVLLMEAGGAVSDDARDWVYAKELSKPAVRPVVALPDVVLIFLFHAGLWPEFTAGSSLSPQIMR
jgi:hypothetical protein